MALKRFWSILPSLALLGATALVVLLARQLGEVRAQRDLIAQRAQSLQPGAYAPLHTAPTLDGRQVSLGSVRPGTRQVLFVYDTRCSFCLASVPAWQAIADRFRDDPGVSVVAVSLDSVEATRRYAARHGLRYPTAIVSDPRTASLFRFNNVPQTLVIDERGRVMHSRVGVLNESAARDSVLAAIARPLPGPLARAPG